MRDDPKDGPTVAELLEQALTPAELRRFYELLVGLIESSQRPWYERPPSSPALGPAKSTPRRR